jgi:enterochelin esterase family protein
VADPKLVQARRLGTPLIDRTTVTFVWEGDRRVHVMGDWTDWEAAPMPLRKRATGIRALTLDFPEDAYLEYAFWDPQTGERLADPLNSQTVADGMGGTNNFFVMPDRPANPLIRRRRDVPAGLITRHRAETRGLLARDVRAVSLYAPPTREDVPLLVVLDGSDYLRRGKLARVVDHLIVEGRIRPVAMALVDHGATARIAEYGCSDATLAFLEQVLLPLAHDELNLVDGPHGILGASMGGLMGVCSAVRRPDVFGTVLSQSGAFIINGFESAAFDLVRHLPVAPIRVWMDVGEFESFLGANRQMHELLEERGYQVTYREYPGGHNYTSWRDDVWRGLEALYPPL